MLAEPVAADWTWFSSGREVFPAMLTAIEAARHLVCLEAYIFAADSLGEQFREALIRARQRGARVRARATSVQIIVAYFLPSWRIRRDLMRIARCGGKVRLILPGKSDVLASRLAGQSLYQRFLKARVQIYEYQPQVLHAKLIIADDIVYVGSANLDPRSLDINYELMIRFDQKAMADQARAIFDGRLAHCRAITGEEWSRSRTIWRRLRQRWAYWLLVRIDPYLARRQWQGLPD